ncbi:hypothetical protein NPIL_443991 [Nephila pilipes]|uniref:Uncharacterized protein n=1 Tax=Nephila pilipes TaxID=299642 RepID=A0A8X6MUZ3_NEPPI|nr:hypothetical protein NPIL_443991 [Nephila pilipes]
MKRISQLSSVVGRGREKNTSIRPPPPRIGQTQQERERRNTPIHQQNYRVIRQRNYGHSSWKPCNKSNKPCTRQQQKQKKKATRKVKLILGEPLSRRPEGFVNGDKVRWIISSNVPERYGTLFGGQVLETEFVNRVVALGWGFSRPNRREKANRESSRAWRRGGSNDHFYVLRN